MTALRPRRLAHRGSVVASGFVVDPALVGVAEARRRALALWAPGAVIREVDGLLVITGLRATRVRAELAPGAPIVDDGGLPTTVPLERDEREALAAEAPPRALVVARDGQAHVVADGAAVDVGAWIDLDDAAVIAVEALAAPPVRAALAAPVLDVRQVLGVGAAVDAGVGAELVRALAGARPDPAASGGAAPSRPSRWSRFLGWLAERAGPRRAPSSSTGGVRRAVRASWWRRLRMRLGGRRPVRGALPPPDAPEIAPPPPTWRDRLRDRLLRALWESRLGRELGRRHAEYLRRMLELFDRGDLDAALRHAIPIGGSDGDAGGLSGGVPRPRDDIKLSMTDPQGRRSLIPVSEDGREMIRARYRAALERLERLGRIEEAAFVLAELLGDVAGAVALLERHRRHAVAAQLAEGRKLAPGLVVRLWFLAGDRARAIAVARRHRAWADAIARLERDGGDQATALRLLWADALADAGDYVQAVDVAWPVAEARHLTMAWIERGIAAGGRAAARLLVRKLSAQPTSYAEVAPALLTILDDPDDDAVWRRVALVDALVASPPSPELRAIARAAVRAVIADLGHGADGDAPALLPRLMRFADDAALRADQPVIPPGQRPLALVDRDAPFERRWSSGDAGVIAVHDAAPLPGGRLILALGELGVRFLGRDGRTLAHVDQPAERLVISDHGTRALALMPRRDSMRVARLDLVERRGAFWCDAAIRGGAHTYDGDTWLVHAGRDVLAIDATASSWKATWGVTCDDNVWSIRRDGDLFAFLIGPRPAEIWCYEGTTLRRRRPYPRLELGGEEARLVTLVPRPVAQDWCDVSVPFHGGELHLTWSTGSLPLGVGESSGLDVEGRLAAAGVVDDNGVTVHTAYLAADRERIFARLMLDGARRASLRVSDLSLTIADDRGRVLVFDLRAGVVRRDLRIVP